MGKGHLTLLVRLSHLAPDIVPALRLSRICLNSASLDSGPKFLSDTLYNPRPENTLFVLRAMVRNCNASKSDHLSRNVHKGCFRKARICARLTDRLNRYLKLANGQLDALMDSPASTLSQSEFGSQSAISSDPLKFETLLAGWAAERRPVQKTVYEYKRVMRTLAGFLGHDDARRTRACF